MNVAFIFPDGDCLLTVSLEAVPMPGDHIHFGKITYNFFQHDKDYKKFKEEEYEFRQWKVEHVTWSIDGNYNYPMVQLIERDTEAKPA